ncbi:hypothetical protein DOE78_11525 [Bacillus sp. Y1]|nr:O-methyltransferase [Bacillus sp. Y1]AYA76017.1 hypothetical protein DOE78_11525 [Bacillus sp. Y1]
MSDSTETRRPSYEQINYRVRPAKSIERKMLCESFRRLTHFSPVEDYRYIGFGSTFFADFLLFHKQLGIENMISIEKDYENEDRFLYNKPYKCIEIKFGDSNDQLPQLDWGSTKDIVWLDYDGRLDLSVLDDINTVFFNISSGSIVLTTVNIYYKRGQEVNVLNKYLEHKAPEGITNDDLESWKAAKVCRKIIHDKINETLEDRNRTEPDGKKFKFKPLYYFGYSDGTKMLTFGGIVFREDEESTFDECKFNQLPYIKLDDDMYFIDVPSLTYKEIRHLDSQLPHEDLTSVTSPGVKPEDIKRYSVLYKYFPAFSETEI